MTTTDVPFPLWILIQRGPGPWRPVMRAPGFIAAFTTTECAREAGSAEAEFRFVCRATLLRVMDEFARQGVMGVCLDATTEREGKLIPFAPAESARDRTRQSDEVAALAE